MDLISPGHFNSLKACDESCTSQWYCHFWPEKLKFPFKSLYTFKKYIFRNVERTRIARIMYFHIKSYLESDASDLSAQEPFTGYVWIFLASEVDQI